MGITDRRECPCNNRDDATAGIQRQSRPRRPPEQGLDPSPGPCSAADQAVGLAKWRFLTRRDLRQTSLGSAGQGQGTETDPVPDPTLHPFNFSMPARRDRTFMKGRGPSSGAYRTVDAQRSGCGAHVSEVIPVSM